VSGQTLWRCIDVGTGTGFLAAGLGPRVERVVGVDNSPAMLDVAQANLHSLGVANVELRHGGEQLERHFAEAGLEAYSAESLGMQ
jgi:protein-L-isoaspartate O-methyltransferase